MGRFENEGLVMAMRDIVRYLRLYASPRKRFVYYLNRIMRKSLIAEKVQGSKMLLNLKNKGIQTDLFLHGIREPEATKFFQGILKPNMVVVDVGANVGYYTLMEARVCKKVYAIEPEPTNYKALQYNIKMNKYENVKTLMAAAGARNSTALLNISSTSNWHKIGDRGIPVQLVTIDSLLNGKRVDLVRMDVEGYELNVLKGMTETLRYPVTLFLEVHRDFLKAYGQSLEELFEFLTVYKFYVVASFIWGKPGPTGYLRGLLGNERTRSTLMRGISSHLFLRKE